MKVLDDYDVGDKVMLLIKMGDEKLELVVVLEEQITINDIEHILYMHAIIFLYLTTLVETPTKVKYGVNMITLCLINFFFHC